MPGRCSGDGIMRKPISDWYDSFRNKQKACFLFEDNLFDQFKEIYYRRNLVVHNQGIVNEVYLNYIKNTKVKIGEKLNVDSDYLENAFLLTSLMLVDTFFGLRRVADDKDELITWIISYGYDCLVEQKWGKAKYIFRVILQDEGIKAIDKQIAQVNYWIAIKNLEGISAIQDDVNSLDVSAMQLQFSVAKEALLNNYKEVSVLLDQCLRRGEISSYYIKTWPLFNEFRASDEYSDFVEKHKDEFGTGEYEAPTNSETILLSSAEGERDELFDNKEQ